MVVNFFDSHDEKMTDLPKEVILLHAYFFIHYVSLWDLWVFGCRRSNRKRKRLRVKYEDFWVWKWRRGWSSWYFWV